MNNYCIDCGEAISHRAKRCRSCAARERNIEHWKHPSKKKLEHIQKLAKMPRTENQIESSRKGARNAAKLPRTEKQLVASRENRKRAVEAAAKLPRTEKQLAVSQKYCRENIKKAHKLPRTEKQIMASRESFKKAVEAAARLPRTEKQRLIAQENARKLGKLPKTEKQLKNFESSWEDNFIEKALAWHYSDYIIKRQFYLKGLNHAFDIAIPKLKILIEIDSDYWHRNRKNRDTQVNNFAGNIGWELYRFNDAKLKEFGVI